MKLNLDGYQSKREPLTMGASDLRPILNKTSIQANRCCRDGVATVSKLLVYQLGLDNILSEKD